MVANYLKRYSPKVKVLTQFFSFQIGLQFLNLLFGFLIIRWLSKEDYAKYSITFSFQSFVNALVDLGFSSAIIGMIGNNYADKQMVGEYIKVAKFYRQRLFWLIVPVSCVFFIFLVSKYDWKATDCFFLYSSVVVFLLAQGWSSYYSPLLLIHKSYDAYYKPQIVSSFYKLIVLVGFHIGELLNVFIGVWLNTFSMVFNAVSYKNATTQYYTATDIVNGNKKAEVRNYLLPIIPGLIFWAFQGQISIFLISFFGNSDNIADVAALSRLGQIFLLLSALSTVVISPFLARQTGKSFVRYFLISSFLAISISGLLVSLAFFYPLPFLFLLGSDYYNLKHEVGFIMISGSVSYLAGFFYSIQSVKKWMFLWHSVLNIVLTLVIQIGCIVSFKLDSTLNVILISIFSAAVNMCTNFLVCIFAIVKRKF